MSEEKKTGRYDSHFRPWERHVTMLSAKAGGPERRGWGNCMILSVAGTQRGRSPKRGSAQDPQHPIYLYLCQLESLHFSLLPGALSGGHGESQCTSRKRPEGGSKTKAHQAEGSQQSALSLQQL